MSDDFRGTTVCTAGAAGAQCFFLSWSSVRAFRTTISWKVLMDFHRTYTKGALQDRDSASARCKGQWVIGQGDGGRL